MEQWYIYRNQQQYGPYSVEQLLQMASSNQLFQGDLYAVAGGSWLTFDNAYSLWNQSVTKRQPVKRKKKHGCLITLLVFFLIIVGIVSITLLTKKSSNLKLGAKTSEITATIDSDGGSITINDSTSSINGFSIIVPENAYSEEKEFTITTTEITDSNFVSSFQPITPLISIDNGHEFADEPMAVTIPIEKTDDQFAMGFYYDKKTGELEGIPFSELTNQSITLVTCHFSDIMVAVTDRETLMSLEVDTGFVPGYDDWQFVNYGSEIAPGGHCAGQSVTMMWYFTEQYQGAGERRLYGRYDNNDYGYGTIDFQQDDSLGYRFASVVQSVMAFDSYSRTFLKYVANMDAYDTYCGFVFSMQMTGEPQYLSIRGDYTNSEGKTSNVGHAIVVYKVDKGVMYVADPNKPGMANRTITLSGSNSFSKYYSGLNATQITKEGEIIFDEMYYYAKSSMIDYSMIAGYYNQVLDKTIGNDKFDNCTIEKLVSIDPVTGVKTWEPANDEYNLTTKDTSDVSAALAGKIVFRIKGPYSNIGVMPFSGVSPVKSIEGYSLLGGDGYQEYTLELEKGVNHFGFYTLIEFTNNNNAETYYNNFKRIKVIYDQIVDLEFKDQPYTVIQDIETEFEAECSGAPSGTVFQWDFGDNTDWQESKEAKTSHVYKEPGDYMITLQLISTKDGTVLAEASADLKVSELYGTWDMNYTIEEAGAVDYIVNMIVQVFVSFFEQIFGENMEDVQEVTIEGTVIDCIMVIYPPETEGGTIRIQVQQLSSSTEFVEVSEEIWNGTVTIEDNNIKINITSEGQDVGFTFKGIIDEYGMNGTYNAVVMSGSFEATHQ